MSESCAAMDMDTITKEMHIEDSEEMGHFLENFNDSEGCEDNDISMTGEEAAHVASMMQL